jgi:hypothetical protein
MENRKTLVSKNGYSLDQVTHLDENGNVIKITFEVIDPSGAVVGTFDNIDEARELYKTLVPAPKPINKPKGPSGPSM